MSCYNIRFANQEDKDNVLSWRNHPEVRQSMFTDHVISQTEHDTWWRQTMLATDRQILIFQKNQQDVAVITIYKWDKAQATAWWGFYLNNDLLTQADKTATWLALEEAIIDYSNNQLKLYKLYGEVLQSNKAVWILHSKSGFEKCPIPNDATNINKDVIYMAYTHTHNKVDTRASLFIFASHNTDFLSHALTQQANQYYQFPYKIEQTPFGQYALLLREQADSSALSQRIHANNSSYMFVERLEDFFDETSVPITTENLNLLDEKIHQYLKLVTYVAQKGHKVFVADFNLQASITFNAQERLSNHPIQQLILKWNETLYQLNEQNVSILPYHYLIQQQGQSFSEKYWYLARSPFNSQMLESYAKMLIGAIFSTHEISARVIVLDLDNTLWQGVIGDDGIEGIQLGGDYPGNIYQELQKLFLALKQSGILLCICSKNTESIALACIEQHPEMRLQKSDFIGWRINWHSKSDNIASLSKELNIGLQSFCFIDDNIVEREEMKQMFPQIFVPSLPNDPAQWHRFISTLPELYRQNVSSDDKVRSERYQLRKQLTDLGQQFTSKVDFLTSLEMQIKVEHCDATNQARTLQLFTKTNQFNTTTKRYTQHQLSQLMQDTDTLVLHIKLKDKHQASYEGIAAMVISGVSTQTWSIDHIVMSCRVMGREIEHALLTSLLIKAKHTGINKVIGCFIATTKNTPVSSLFADNHFQWQQNQWQCDVALYLPPTDLPDIHIQWPQDTLRGQDS